MVNNTIQVNHRHYTRPRLPPPRTQHFSAQKLDIYPSIMDRIPNQLGPADGD